MNKNKPTIKKALSYSPILLAAIIFGLTQLFKNKPTFTETIYSQSIYPITAKLLSVLSFHIPFSLSDTLYIAIILSILVLIILVCIKRIKFSYFAKRITQIISLTYSLFYILWGFNYYRVPLDKRIEIENRPANTEEFIEVFQEVIKHTNNSYTEFDSLNQESLNLDIEKSYERLSDYLGISYSLNQRRIKNITFSNFFAKATILGYYGPFFSEVHINKHLSTWDIPIVIAHEKAHQFGITSEAEANFYGCMATLNCDNKYANYSAWLFILDYFLYEARNLKDKNTLTKNIDKSVKEDLISQHKHWMQWRHAKIDKITSTVNDAYLKSNNVEKGIDDYNHIVQLIVNLYYSNKGTKHFFEY
ncbi:DUF3810 domain-containing protein [Saccharicrinis aurantiacus]|uniref:DUF3810 domain-containing protein n=1 Tax=Saccharicrinis aurantiacus TaxID=1849719 RepID=UPI00094FB0DC|nr:DUF3810 domain-containing protein [Saccharicrinis aurantiacus]